MRFEDGHKQENSGHETTHQAAKGLKAKHGGKEGNTNKQRTEIQNKHGESNRLEEGKRFQTNGRPFPPPGRKHSRAVGAFGLKVMNEQIVHMFKGQSSLEAFQSTAAGCVHFPRIL